MTSTITTLNSQLNTLLEQQASIIRDAEAFAKDLENASMKELKQIASEWNVIPDNKTKKASYIASLHQAYAEKNGLAEVNEQIEKLQFQIKCAEAQELANALQKMVRVFLMEDHSWWVATDEEYKFVYPEQGMEIHFTAHPEKPANICERCNKQASNYLVKSGKVLCAACVKETSKPLPLTSNPAILMQDVKINGTAYTVYGCDKEELAQETLALTDAIHREEPLQGVTSFLESLAVFASHDILPLNIVGDIELYEQLKSQWDDMGGDEKCQCDWCVAEPLHYQEQEELQHAEKQERFHVQSVTRPEIKEEYFHQEKETFWMICDASGNPVSDRTYGTVLGDPGFAQQECNSLNKLAKFAIGDRVLVLPQAGDLRVGDTAIIQQEFITMYPCPTVQYEVRFEEESRYSNPMSQVYFSQCLAKVNTPPPHITPMDMAIRTEVQDLEDALLFEQVPTQSQEELQHTTALFAHVVLQQNPLSYVDILPEGNITISTQQGNVTLSAQSAYALLEALYQQKDLLYQAVQKDESEPTQKSELQQYAEKHLWEHIKEAGIILYTIVTDRLDTFTRMGYPIRYLLPNATTPELFHSSNDAEREELEEEYQKRDALYRDPLLTENKKAILLGTDLLSWPREERITGRYGLVALFDEDWDQSPWQTDITSLTGKHGSLVAVLNGEEIELGKGIFSIEDIEEIYYVGLIPDEDRNVEWLSPTQLHKVDGHITNKPVELWFVEQ